MEKYVVEIEFWATATAADELMHVLAYLVHRHRLLYDQSVAMSKVPDPPK